MNKKVYDMITDELWPDGPKFIRRDDTFRLGTDSVLLADFAGAGHARCACDLGCGAGIIGLIMAWNDPSLAVDGVELLPDWAATAREKHPDEWSG